MQKERLVQRKSMAINGAFSFAAKVVAMLIPFMVYPYVMRALGAESFGKVTYVESLISYFSLFAILGIGTYAQRECSVRRDDPIGLQQVASRSFALNLIMTVVSFIIYLCLCFFVPNMKSERPLFLVFSLWIVASGLSLEWLYTAQERFDLVSIREIVAKVLYLILCFIFVKSNDSYLIFGIIVVFTSTVFPMLWNIIGILKGECGVVPNLRFSTGFTDCLKPVLFLALLTIGSKLFTDFDVLMIKWFIPNDNDKAVGLYNSAILLPKALDVLLMTVSAVVTPKLFIATRKNDEKRVVEIMNKTSNALFLIAIPSIITCLIFSKEILLLFAGFEYVTAAPVLQIYSLIIFGVLVITLAGTRTYIARQKEQKLFCILICGAVLNIIFNYIFIRVYGIIGAALATMCAYVVVMFVELTLEKTWHYIFTYDKFKYLIASIFLIVVYLISKRYFCYSSDIVFAIILAGLLYTIVLFVMRESTLLQVYKKVNGILKKKI